MAAQEAAVIVAEAIISLFANSTSKADADMVVRWIGTIQCINGRLY